MSQTPRDLAAEVARSGRLSPLDAATLGRSLARQLSQGHRIGAVYGVLSPFAVQVRQTQPRQGGAADYRLANPDDQREAPIDPMCRAPELASGAKQTAASDVFALGAVVLQATTGRRGSLAAGLPLNGPQSVPDPLWQVLVQLTQTDPRYRPTADQAESMFASAYAEMRDTGVGAPPPQVLPYEEARESSRVAPVIVLLLILAIVAAVAYFAIRQLVGDDDGDSLAPTSTPTTEQTTATDEPAPEPDEDEGDAGEPAEGEPPTGAEYSGQTILPNGDEAAFVMPSGNVWCWMVGDGDTSWVTCSIAEKSFTAEGDDPNCPDANAVSMVDSEAQWVCVDEVALPQAAEGQAAASWLPEDGNLFDDQYAVLEYDYTIELGALSCTSASSGISCVNSDTGHSFTLAREVFEFN